MNEILRHPQEIQDTFLPKTESKESERLLFLKELHASAQKFDQETYPRIQELVTGCPDLSVEHCKTLLHHVMDEIRANEVLQVAKYNQLKQDPELGKFIRHDVKNIAIKTVNVRDMLLEASDMDEQYFHLTVLANNWPLFSLTVQDVIGRALEKEGEHLNKTPLNPEFIDTALVAFEKNLNKDLMSDPAFVRDSGTVHCFERSGSLTETLDGDGRLVTNQPLIMNALFNIIRNACSKQIDAGEGGVELSIVRDMSELVFRVSDNGIGMRADQLDPDKDSFIFHEGKSERGSSGLGLAHLPKRLLDVGIEMNVASHKRDAGLETTVFYGVESSDSQELTKRKDQLKESLITKKASTIFEFRLPIQPVESN